MGLGLGDNNIIEKAKTITMRKEVQIKLPTTPNFITIAGQTVHISDIDEATLREVGKAWIEELVARSKRRKMRGAK